MCLRLFETLFWIGTKLLIIVGTLLYLFDIGSDISFSVQLFLNCHVNYGAAAITIIVIAYLFSSFFPCVSANIEENCCLASCGFLLNYFRLNWGDLTGNELNNDEKVYVHCVKFIESIVESLPQIGLSFYIIHHHGWFDAALPDSLAFEGDIQKLSLIGSILSITISMATRRAWWKMRGEAPEKMDIFVAFLWNFVPMTCFLVAYYIIMADSKWILIVYSCMSPIACVAFLINLFFLYFTSKTLAKKLYDWMFNSRFSINKFLLANTFIMASLHTIQIYAIGLEDPSLKVKPFNACNATDIPNSGYNATYVEDTALEDHDQLNFVHMHPDEFVIIIWSAVVVALVHILFEMKFSTKREQSFFGLFILFDYGKECDEDDDDVQDNCLDYFCNCILNSNKDKSQANEDGKAIEENHQLKNLTSEETV